MRPMVAWPVFLVFIPSPNPFHCISLFFCLALSHGFSCLSLVLAFFRRIGVSLLFASGRAEMHIPPILVWWIMSCCFATVKNVGACVFFGADKGQIRSCILFLERRLVWTRVQRKSEGVGFWSECETGGGGT